ncbi:hypothetical protein Q9Q99_06935 [Curtobacterium flaccumfaciens]|nr:hypothetical protein Q9Q99_06935 [Curtobacterium flaccumfaciens]
MARTKNSTQKQGRSGNPAKAAAPARTKREGDRTRLDRRRASAHPDPRRRPGRAGHRRRVRRQR